MCGAAGSGRRGSPRVDVTPHEQGEEAIAHGTALPAASPAEAPLRPDPVLAIAVIGHQGFGPEGEDAERLAREARQVFAALDADTARIAAENAALYGPSPPRLRVVTGLRDGADLVIAAAALEAGLEIRAVLPGPPALCRAALASDAARRLFDEILAAAPEPFFLCGDPAQPADRARAGASLIDRADLLLAFWNRKAGWSRAGTASLVQEAVDRRLPVLVLPQRPGDAVTVIDDPDELLLPAHAADLPHVSFALNRDRVLARAFAPPASAYEKRALAEYLVEPLRPQSHRFEYRLFLALARRRAPGSLGLPQSEEWARARAVAALVSPRAAGAVDRMRLLQARQEELAAFYGHRVRSGIVLRYVLAGLGSFLVAIFALLKPEFGLAWLVVQAVITAVTIGETTYALLRRWDERWLDYRSLAERLRCDRFLQPIGIATVRLDAQTSAEDPAWMRWYHRRTLRSCWVGGEIGPAAAEAAWTHLAGTEIEGQIRYHEAAGLRFEDLERRLLWIGTGAVLCTLAASIVLIAVEQAALEGFSLLAPIKIALVTLPAVFLAARGLRAEAGLELAASRSRQALNALREVRRRMEAAPASFDRLDQASRAAAAAMILDTMDWRIGVQRSRSPYRPGEAGGGGEKP